MKSEIDDLIENLAGSPHKWFEMLEPAAKVELDKIREKYRAGGFARFPRAAIVRAILVLAKKKQWHVAEKFGVDAWLRK